jgi:hypothetical protein
MSSSYAAIRVSPSMVLGYLFANILGYGTATTIELGGVEQLPTATFEVEDRLEPSHRVALDWLAFTKEVLPNARPLTPEERSSINEFFWSHFK